MTPEEAGKVSEYLPRLDDLMTLAPGTTWFCIRTPRRFFRWAFPFIGRNQWWSVTVACFVALFALTGCAKPQSVRVIRECPATSGFSGHADYSILEQTDTLVRFEAPGLWGKPGDTFVYIEQ